MFKFLSKPIKNQTIGVSESADEYCVVSIIDNTPQVLWLDKNLSAQEMINSVLSQFSLPTESLQWVRAVPHHFIWRKYLTLSESYTETLLYRQVIQIIKQELPIAIGDIYFDYKVHCNHAQNLKHLSIYALRKVFGDLLKIEPQTKLDCELLCFYRGLQYLNQKFSFISENEDKAFLYKGIIFQVKNYRIETSEPNKYQESFFDINKVQIPYINKNHQLFTSALGAALWNQSI